VIIQEPLRELAATSLLGLAEEAKPRLQSFFRKAGGSRGSSILGTLREVQHE
jgi:hypothetical protein